MSDEPRQRSSPNFLHTDERRRFPPHLSLVSGLLMGGADAIPGVSGGTVALIIGVYDRFIESLSTAVKLPLLVRSKQGQDRLKEAFLFLLPLGVGVLISYYLATKLLVGPTDDPGILRRPETAPICFGFFFGLVLVSIREPWRRIDSAGMTHVALAALGAAAAAVFVGLPHSSGEPALWMLAIGGACAIAVMLLPGISGSLLLVILGQYATVAAAVHDGDFAKLGVFAGGIGVGVILFVPLLRALLSKRRGQTMAVLTGLMAGSLRALWPWKDNYDAKSGPMANVGIGDSVLYVIFALACGGAVVWLLARLERKIVEHKALILPKDVGDGSSG